MLAAGAHIIDIGGESTRPGAAEVSIQEELERVVPVMRALRWEFPDALLSVDTRHAEVARAALEEGADILNDITGQADAAMRCVCREIPCGIVVMHMQGEPATMQQNPVYQDVVAEVRSFFEARLALLESEGIDPLRVCLDPGIGFGKTVEHNLSLIRELSALRVQDRPLLMALSRKRFMGSILGDAALAREQVWPTLAMSLLAAERGADMHRVHDIAELCGALKLRQALL
jgi:dihydropteroate synthase